MTANTEKSKSTKGSGSSKEPEFIRGIFNYCDRWCERCRFTDRCRVYHSEQEYMKRHPYNDDDNDAFFAHLAKIFEETKQVLEQKALEMGIDLDSLKEEPENNMIVESEPDHRIIKIAKQYADELYSWLNENRKPNGKAAETLAAISGDDAREFVDAIEVISWYLPLIDIKLKRALLPDDLEDEFQKYDMLGSAKVAMIAIERSIAAHAILLRHLPDEEDSLLRLLTMLEKVRRGCYELFPGAMEFIRPGIDE